MTITGCTILGVKNLKDLFEGTPIDLDSLSRKKLSLDAYNVMYQFLASIRGYDGSLLTDSEGRITSHLSGLLYRNANLLQRGIQLVYVFDGVPPEEKREEIKRRKQIKKEARKEMEKARKVGDMERVRSLAQRTSVITEDIVADSKRLLSLLGIPIVQAPQEGEAQAAYMAKKNDVWACSSQDYDSLLFGAPILIRNLTLSGRRKLPNSNKYITINVEQYNYDELMNALGITREQLIDMCILIGTDYNDGIKGIGPKTAYKYIQKYNTLEKIIKEKDIEFDVDIEIIRSIFLNPKIIDNYKLNFSSINIDGVMEFLCEERGFQEDRIINTLKNAKKGLDSSLKQKSLDAFFN